MSNHPRVPPSSQLIRLVGCLTALTVSLHTLAADPPARIPWTASNVTGSPEPPHPFQTVRAFPNLTFKAPVEVAFAPGSNRVFVAVERGQVYSFKNDENAAEPDLFFDPSKVQTLAKTEGATGIGSAYAIAFHPRFAENHYVYLQYSLNFKTNARNHENGSRISRFTVIPSDPPAIDYASEVIVLQYLSGGHNGCCLNFGPKDGYLYISLGDAGDPNPPDPFNSGQDVSDLLCSILRIDVDRSSADRAYAIPADNPFTKLAGARPEVFAYGLRNPWRFGFDKATGFCWVGDVGWELWESVYCAKPGTNCGWSIMEGPNPVHPDGKRGPTPITPPAATVNHSDAASMTGGFVYHGSKLPALQNHYLFGDWQTRRLWAAKVKGDTLEPYREVALTDQRIVTIVEAPDGEPIIADHQGGGLYRLAPNVVSESVKPFPRKLSDTGLFTSTPKQSPQAGVYPFAIHAPQWCDGATAERWAAIPGDGKVAWGKGVWGDDKPTWPKDSVLARTLSLETTPGDAATRRRVETQLLHFDGKQWQAYSYAWNDQQTDAELVPASGKDVPIEVRDARFPTGSRRQAWHFASRAQCLTCHNSWDDYTLAFNEPELRDLKTADGEEQVAAFKRLGFLVGPKDGAPPKAEDLARLNQTFVDPYDPHADLTDRARTYLHVNCSSCHRFGGGGSALFDTRKELPIDKTNLVDAKPNLGGFTLDDPRVICPGDPGRSVLLYRASKTGSGRMPAIGSNVPDERGLGLLREWIAAMPGDKPADERAAALKSLAAAQSPTPDAAAAIDRLLANTSGALDLALQIDAGKLPAPVAATAIAKGYASTHDTTRDLFRRFDPADANKARLGSDINPQQLLSLKGDPTKGRKIFFELNSTGLCARCHKVDAQGQDFGPDLTHVATKYPNRADLLDNILNPSKVIADGYATHTVRTKSGDTVSGFLVKQTAGQIVLKTPDLKEVHIPTTTIEKMTTEKLSAMPEALLADLEPQEAADLLEYLTTLK